MSKKAEWVDSGLNSWCSLGHIKLMAYKSSDRDWVGYMIVPDDKDGFVCLANRLNKATKEEAQTAIVAAAREFLQQALDALPENG